MKSFKNLVTFLQDPEAGPQQDICCESAPMAWSKLLDIDKVGIQHRLDYVLRNPTLTLLQQANLEPDELPLTLLESIAELKDGWQVAHPEVTDYEAVVNHYSDAGESLTVEALKLCRPYYDKSIFGKLTYSASS